MDAYRRKLGDFADDMFGSSEGSDPTAGGSLSSGDDNRSKADKFYLATIVFGLVISGLLIWIVNPIAIQYILAALWGMIIGGALLIYLPARILITIIGFLVGIGGTDIGGLSQVVEKMSTTVAEVTKTINASGPVELQRWAVLLFFVVVALCCLPAYSEK